MQKTITLPESPGFSPFYPGSICLVTAVNAAGRADICTVEAWALVNGSPRLYGIAMCARTSGQYFRKRYTTACIEQTGQFVINIPHAGLKKAWDICGAISLNDDPAADKFVLAGLTRAHALKVAAPLIAECPVNIECRVYSKLELPTHDWIVGEPLACHTATDVNLAWNSAPEMR